MARVAGASLYTRIAILSLVDHDGVELVRQLGLGVLELPQLQVTCGQGTDLCVTVTRLKMCNRAVER